MARECKQRKGWKNMEAVKQKGQGFLKYEGILYGYFHCSHKFGHKDDDCIIREKDEGLLRKEDSNITNRKRHIMCLICHNIGHFSRHCKNRTYIPSKETHKKVWKVKTKKPVSRTTHGKMWRRKEECKDVEEINISNISEVSKDNDEHNRGINKDGILYEEKQDGDIKEYTDKDEGDEEGCSDECGILF